MLAAVEVRAELDALIGELAEFGEGEDLESTRVGEHGAGPGDELVQAAQPANQLVPRPQIEMVGVAEDDLSAEVFEDILGDGFDGTLCADGHEDGGFDGLVRKVDAGAASAGGGCGEEVKAEGHFIILRGRLGWRRVLSQQPVLPADRAAHAFNFLSR